MVKISVIVPVYNTEKYLRRCLQAIINQTYKEIEIIIIDDGSTDDSGNICDEYAKKDDRIKIIHQKNLGAAAARNVGIEAATGQYIAFIDSDDYIESSMIEELYARIKTENVETVRCNYFIESEGKSRIANKNVKDYFVEITEKENFFRRYAWGQKYYKEIGPFQCNGLYNTNIIKENKIIFEEMMGEDYIFNIQYFNHTDKIYYYSKPLYYYTQHNQSATNSFPNELTIVKNIKCLKRLGELIKDETTKNIHIYGTMQFLFRKIALADVKIKDKRKQIKRIMKDKFFREKVTNKGIGEFNFEKRTIYALYKLKSATMIILFINLVHLYYKIKERGENQ